MKVLKALLLVALLMNFNLILTAQQSSKTKAASKLYEKGGEVEVINATKINTSSTEFSPALYQNGIVFASSRFKNGERDKKIDETFYELFYAEVDEEGLPLEPEEFSLRINSHLHEGPVTFNRAGDLMYFTRNYIRKGVRKANSRGQTVMKIYEARKGKKDWKHVRALSFCDDEYSYVHPTLSTDGKKLFFSSNAPGGYGGMDLYVSERVDGKWSEPINLGEEINTAKNELFPFIHSSGNLIFASNGREGFGELDLYMIDISSRKWGKATNLGEPFNSPSDDLGLILNPEGTKGYFTSSREGGHGKDDIYMFNAPEGIWGRTRPKQIQASITIEDVQNRQKLDGVEVRVFEKNKESYYNAQGKKLYESVLTPSKGQNETLVFKKLQNEISQLGPPDVLTNQRGETSLDLEGEKKYLILAYKAGYLSQTREFTASPDAESPQVNFRLERIPATLAEEKVVEKEEKPSVAKEHKPLTDESALAKGSVIVLENIYYDFNKSYIRAGAAEELEELLSMMNRFPSMVIELSSHTDSRGGEKYNRQLSMKRAESAMQYLTARGIAINRVQAIGYGESSLRNHCRDGVECSEEEHQYNRRTEVKVISLDAAVDIKYSNKRPEVINGKN